MRQLKYKTPEFYSKWVHLLLDYETWRAFDIYFPFYREILSGWKKKNPSSTTSYARKLLLLTQPSMNHNTDRLFFSIEEIFSSFPPLRKKQFLILHFHIRILCCSPVAIYSLPLWVRGELLKYSSLEWCSALISSTVRQHWHKAISLKSSHKGGWDLACKTWSRYRLQQDKPRLVETLIPHLTEILHWHLLAQPLIFYNNPSLQQMLERMF